MKNQSRCVQWAIIIILGLLLTACGTKFKNISPKENLLTKQGKSIGLVWISGIQVGPDENQKYVAQHIQLGTQGLLDIAINAAMAADLKDALEKINVDALVEKHFFKVFTPAFDEVGFVIKNDPVAYCLELNKNCTNQVGLLDTELLGAYEFPQFRNIYDFKSLINKLDVDYLLVVAVELVGTGRSYFSMVPTSPPKGVAVVFSYLIERKTGSVISQHLASVTEDSKGEWDQPPEYDNLMQAARDSLEIAMDEIYIDIFKQAP